MVSLGAEACGGRVIVRNLACIVTVTGMRIGRNMEIRPLGGAPGCLAMLLISVALSILLTVLLNLLIR